jgi:hypothetical protein
MHVSPKRERKSHVGFSPVAVAGPNTINGGCTQSHYPQLRLVLPRAKEVECLVSFIPVEGRHVVSVVMTVV